MINISSIQMIQACIFFYKFTWGYIKYKRLGKNTWWAEFKILSNLHLNTNTHTCTHVHTRTHARTHTNTHTLFKVLNALWKQTVSDPVRVCRKTRWEPGSVRKSVWRLCPYFIHTLKLLISPPHHSVTQIPCCHNVPYIFDMGAIFKTWVFQLYEKLKRSDGGEGMKDGVKKTGRWQGGREGGGRGRDGDRTS